LQHFKKYAFNKNIQTKKNSACFIERDYIKNIGGNLTLKPPGSDLEHPSINVVKHFETVLPIIRRKKSRVSLFLVPLFRNIFSPSMAEQMTTLAATSQCVFPGADLTTSICNASVAKIYSATNS
jgi:hypothetical protein